MSKSDEEECKEIHKKLNKSDKWDILRMSLFIMLVAIALFVFFTQEEVFKKISAALAAVLGLTPMVLRLFEQGRNTGSAVS